ncbi:MAG TPA: XrtA/PEP-CTERM system TPR-repeat protein PrsT [Rhodanobacteraceae bacterium]|nr:XrtA/PEP-CTERM system TPR-repeat protein PrsT [Rhodanobacteraceae bacterium]
MKILNGWAPRRVLVLVSVGLMLAGCGLGSGKGSVAAGLRYQESGKYGAASIEAKKVLQRDDKNGDAWLLLGESSLMLGNPKDALSELEKARANGVVKSRWVVPTSQALLVMHQFDKLAATAAPDSSLDAGLQAKLDVLRGDAERGLKQSDKARQSYEAALKQQSGNPLALVGLASIARESGDTSAAARYVDQALAAAPDNPQALVAKGDLAAASGDYAAAEADYQKALDVKRPDWLPQDGFAARMRLAEVQTQQKHYDQALANLKTLEKMSPGQPGPLYLQAVVLYQQGHLDQATTQLQQVLRVAPNSGPAQTLMGAVNYAQGNYAQAEMYLSNAMGVDQKNEAIRKLLALTYFREGRSAQALNTLRPAVPGQPTDAELLAQLQRAAAEGAGMPSKAGQAAAASSAAKVAGPLVGAENALAGGDTAEAIRQLKAAPKGDAGMESQRATMLAIAYLRDKHPGQAVKAASDYVAQHPKDSSAHLLYGTALIAAGKHKEARAQYEEAIRLDPENASALMSMGSLDAVEGNYKGAENQYETVLKQDPHNATAMAVLGKLAATQGNKADAIKWFRQAIAVQPKSASAYVELVMLYSQNGQFDDAATVAKQLSDALPGNPAALNAFGAAELNAGRHAAALPPLEKAVKLEPKSPLYRINLARAQLLNKDAKAAEGNLDTVIRADPADAQAVALMAFLKLQNHDQQGALALAQSLQEQSATTTKVAGFALEGDLYMAGKAYAKAADAYQQGLKIQYDRPLVVKSFLAQSSSGAKNPEGVLQTWLARHSDDAAMRLMLAQYYLDHARNAQAAEQYEAVLKAFPTNVGAMNNLAWIYTEQKNPKALALAEQAHKLAPDSASVQDTYGWALVAAGQAKTALPILAKAAKAAPKVPAIQYHLAVAQARTGDRAGARATLEALQKSGGDFPAKPAADKLYQELNTAGAGAGG